MGWIVGYFRRTFRPVYLGEVSLVVGYNLRQTTEMFDILEEQGKIRQMSAYEKATAGFDDRAATYVAVNLGRETFDDDDEERWDV